MPIKMTNKQIIPIIVFLLCIGIANAIEFYEGSVVINTFNADVSIGQNADVTLNYTLAGNEKVSLNFENVPESAQITANGQSYGRSFDLEINGSAFILVKYTADVGTEAIKELTIDPNILFNGLVSANRVQNYFVKIKMPSNVNELLSSSESPSEISTEGGRKVFIWEKTNAYASSLTIDWHTLNINIDVERIVPSEITDEFVVKNVIRNNGNDISNVRLVQTWLEGDFDPVSPLNEFERIEAGNDRRLEWKKTISSIPGGSVGEFSYRLKVLNRGENVVFRHLYLYVGDVLVKIVEKAEYTTLGSAEPSNISDINVTSATEVAAFVTEDGIIVPEEPSEDGASLIPPITEEDIEAEFLPEAPPKKEPTIPDRRTLFWTGILVAILALVVLLFIYLNRRKEKGVKF